MKKIIALLLVAVIIVSCTGCGSKPSKNPCVECGGTGKCTLCEGDGHCIRCHGKGTELMPNFVGDGYYEMECFACEGRCFCPPCKGTGRCWRCGGTGDEPQR